MCTSSGVWYAKLPCHFIVQALLPVTHPFSPGQADWSSKASFLIPSPLRHAYIQIANVLRLVQTAHVGCHTARYAMLNYCVGASLWSEHTR